MIPQAYITEWADQVPWQTNEQVEQDLVICRALVEIFSDEWLASRLAFRGGTALHKLYLKPQPRYSEDIDLVQIRSEPIKETIQRLQARLSFLGDCNVAQKSNNNTLKYRFESEFPPVQNLRLKIEINCREHFNVLGYQQFPFQVSSSWFTGSCKITTYQLEELLGTKLRALYQRRKGRDLYDMYKALVQVPGMDKDALLQCYHAYMDFVEAEPPTQKVYLQNMEAKMQNDEFIGDIAALIRPTENYDLATAFELVRTELLEKIEASKHKDIQPH
ncbi:MAG: nucleotidyl transferase AbiEii/AbiGii toxin family protein [Saprospiraceae bacterium]|nr:nucleotidyl transferase AbiEii/AbiGii toxin family protein [Saprospiraceae bacterium]HMW10721.1 nucleotidyl transferase AbiEii/AbiGii toxin family protein [Bacteroidia bacterium]HMY14393.1 nucleotidyl transferase AbiEii/AbiGii toxin family protein [Bacteroidia bacterium]HMZ39784.1 nucleotidyl transferase AbiEii/AbiGii toxin family protein [Saprospiraceae bacterium]HNA64323.1 nucleotidyl transferase AbiEii/AbiGii toxin family protein [Saprospiraceae bacterium]